MVALLIAIVLVLICLLIWLNVFMVRRARNSATRSDDARKPSIETSDRAQVDTGVDERRKSNSDGHASEVRASSAREANPSGTLRADNAATRSANPVEPAVHAEDEPVTSLEDGHTPADWNDVEVVPGNDAGSAGRKMFQRKERPYVLHGTSVPLFDSRDWHQCFNRLTQDANVMGWIGFQDDKVGACDREYDQAFVETLRTYHSSVVKLQREVGLSNVLETSVVGEEGRVWLLTGNEDVWFALFVERDANLQEVAQGFIAQLATID